MSRRREYGPDEQERFQFWIDRGGTFTDLVARRDDGVIFLHKLLSSHPERYSDAALAGMADLLGVARGAPLPLDQIELVRMGTTVATNALLQRRGEPTLLVVSRGFADLLRIGDQSRPEIFALKIVRPEPLFAAVLEVDQRVTADGEELRAVDEDAVRKALAEAHRFGLRACAILFLHGYLYPEHERLVGSIAAEVGFAQVSLSSSVSPQIRMVARGETSVADAYLTPELRRYSDRIAAALGGAGPRLYFMKSDGGLTAVESFHGRDAVLSGPAGGVVGSVRTALAAGYHKVIGFDMGGTSTDVSHYCGEYERSFESQLAGVRLRVPMLRIDTVAAGGGSQLFYDGQRFRVGPESAGADPGPACYRRGGPLTVTDCHLMLGRLQPDLFPQIFGPGGDQPLDRAVVAAMFEDLAAQIGAAHIVAEGFLRVAVETMAAAIRRISVERGYDLGGYLLNAFGGAGGQLACLVAEALGIDKILAHPYAGVLSAFGIGLADLSARRELPIEARLAPEVVEAAERRVAALEESAREELLKQGVVAGSIVAQRRLFLRYAATDTTLAVAWGSGGVESLRDRFVELYRREFGFDLPGRDLIVAHGEVELIASSAESAELPPLRRRLLDRDGPLQPIGRYPLFMKGIHFEAAPFYRRESMLAGDVIDGPAVVVESVATIVVEPGWRAELIANQQLQIRRLQVSGMASTLLIEGEDEAEIADPVLLEIFNNIFMSLAEQMGATLARTATSANIRERLDFSCALFDGNGALIANAPHVPVHLGSMGASVGAVIERLGSELRRSDVVLLNDPYAGGTHLPDITVVTPLFTSDFESAEVAGEPLFFLASRAHHADVGGITPGSMPPDSRSIDEEGVLIAAEFAVRDGVFREVELRQLFSSGRYPSRNVEQNLSDLRSQIAANQTGARELRRIVSEYGVKRVCRYMGFVLDNAEEEVRRVLATLASGAARHELDSGAVVAVRIDVDHATRSARVDFSGTSGQQSSNFNAPLAVTRAALLYVLRCLVERPIPLNDGCLRPVELIVPEGSMLSPRAPAAVVAGNVEVSQVVTDALLTALGKLACSQGTMNNLTFGNERHQHYETIGGGAGAGPGFAGASGVQVHMTNSRLTDPEVLESRFPVRLEEFSLRRGSGGSGRWPGGAGLVRRIRFLEPMELALLANSHRVAPGGFAGGGDGATGKAVVMRAAGDGSGTSGAIELLDSCDRRSLAAGDVVVIESPGGGGWGAVDGEGGGGVSDTQADRLG